jgi:hypothetical protein
MLRAEEIVVKPVGFLARQRQHLLCTRREIAHGFVTHIRFILLPIGRFVQCCYDRHFNREQSLGRYTGDAGLKSGVRRCVSVMTEQSAFQPAQSRCKTQAFCPNCGRNRGHEAERRIHAAADPHH